MSTPWPTGTVLTRFVKQDDPYDKVLVVGGGNEVVIQPYEEFGESRSISAADVRSQYDIDVPEGGDLPRPTYIDPGPTPEQVFAKLAAENGEHYDPTPPLIHAPTDEELADMDEAQRMLAERAAEEAARSDTVVTQIQEHPQVGQASHEAGPVVKAEESEGNKEDGVTVTEQPSPAKRGRKKTDAQAAKD